MALPKQVQEQLNAAEELQKQLYGDQEPSDPNVPVAEVVTPEAQQVADRKAEPVVEDTESEPAPVEAKEKPAKSDEDAAHWKQKYKTLQGMYDADVPRLHGQVKELSGELEKLKEQVTSAQQQAEKAEATAKHEQLKNLVTDEDRQEFGDDLIEVSRKVAREESAELFRQLEAIAAENAELRKQLGETGQQVTTATFEQRLNRLVPDFEQVNIDPAWIAWLNEVDPILRGPRMVAAQQAFSEGDAEGVAHYVKLFKEAQQPAEATKQVVDQELESQIQPSKTVSTSSTTPAPKGNVYTQEQIQAMFHKVTKLGKTGRLDEARKLEAEIDAAFTQGRVVL